MTKTELKEMLTITLAVHKGESDIFLGKTMQMDPCGGLHNTLKRTPKKCKEFWSTLQTAVSELGGEIEFCQSTDVFFVKKDLH